METLQNEVQVLKEQLEHLKNLLFDERADRIAEHAVLNHKIGVLEKEKRQYQHCVDKQESNNRKNNIIIFGRNEPLKHENKSCESIIREICGSLEVNIEPYAISEAFYVGRNRGSRPIVCKLANFSKKCEILRKNKKDGKYSILHDLTKKERQERKELQHHVNVFRRKGHRAYVRNGAVVVDGHVYTREQLDAPKVNSGNAATGETISAAVKEVEVHTKRAGANNQHDTPSGFAAILDALAATTSRAGPAPTAPHLRFKKQDATLERFAAAASAAALRDTKLASLSLPLPRQRRNTTLTPAARLRSRRAKQPPS